MSFSGDNATDLGSRHASMNQMLPEALQQRQRSMRRTVSTLESPGGDEDADNAHGATTTKRRSIYDQDEEQEQGSFEVKSPRAALGGDANLRQHVMQLLKDHLAMENLVDPTVAEDQPMARALDFFRDQPVQLLNCLDSLENDEPSNEAEAATIFLSRMLLTVSKTEEESQKDPMAFNQKALLLAGCQSFLDFVEEFCSSSLMSFLNVLPYLPEDAERALELRRNPGPSSTSNMIDQLSVARERVQCLSNNLVTLCGYVKQLQDQSNAHLELQNRINFMLSHTDKLEKDERYAIGEGVCKELELRMEYRVVQRVLQAAKRRQAEDAVGGSAAPSPKHGGAGILSPPQLFSPTSASASAATSPKAGDALHASAPTLNEEMMRNAMSATTSPTTTIAPPWERKQGGFPVPLGASEESEGSFSQVPPPPAPPLGARRFSTLSASGAGGILGASSSLEFGAGGSSTPRTLLQQQQQPQPPTASEVAAEVLKRTNMSQTGALFDFYKDWLKSWEAKKQDLADHAMRMTDRGIRLINEALAAFASTELKDRSGASAVSSTVTAASHNPQHRASMQRRMSKAERGPVEPWRNRMTELESTKESGRSATVASHLAPSLLGDVSMVSGQPRTPSPQRRHSAAFTAPSQLPPADEGSAMLNAWRSMKAFSGSHQGNQLLAKSSATSAGALSSSPSPFPEKSSASLPQPKTLAGRAGSAQLRATTPSGLQTNLGLVRRTRDAMHRPKLKLMSAMVLQKFEEARQNTSDRQRQYQPNNNPDGRKSPPPSQPVNLQPDSETARVVTPERKPRPKRAKGPLMLKKSKKPKASSEGDKASSGGGVSGRSMEEAPKWNDFWATSKESSSKRNAPAATPRSEGTESPQEGSVRET